MEYAKLGHSGIEVSRICLGGMSFGEPSPKFHQWTLPEDETRAVIKRAIDQGINFIDTANTYGFGTSEEYIGRALKKLGIPRDEVVLASKVFFNEGRLSREAILREIDGTLARLGTDYLDLYIIHRFDYGTPIEETMEALDSLVRAGKVRALGASEMYAYQLHNMQVVAERNGWTQFTSLQPHHNLLYRENEREMFPVCRQFDMAITPYSPLASGHLCRREWTWDSKRSETDAVVRASTTWRASRISPSSSASPRWRSATACPWRTSRWHGSGRAASNRRLWAVRSHRAWTMRWRRST